MKIVQINSFSNGSTGKIMMNIHKALLKEGYESYVVWGRGRQAENDNEIYMNDKLGVYFHALYSRLTGKTGFASKRATKKLLKKLDIIKPDIVHLHNVHGYYINIELLFNYLKENNIKVIWTLHDCWTFTGQCPHFTYVNCNKWKTQCKNCPQLNQYPKSFVDNSKWNYQKKKELFTNLNLTIVTPSKWLANLVKESYLKDYAVEVINNGIDLNIFKPTPSNFREKYNLKDKKIVLGIAGVWTERKGLNDFIELSKMIDDDYQIVLVGLNKKQIKNMPENIIGIERTESQQELAEIYTAADVFFNPSVEESFGLTTIEAISCGTKTIAYNVAALLEITMNSNIYIIEKKNKGNEILINNVIKKICNNNINNMANSKKKYCILEMCHNYLEIYNNK